MSFHGRVLILGQDGYLGWALTVYLRSKGIECLGVDNFMRRDNVAKIGSKSLTPIGREDRVDEAVDIRQTIRVETLLKNFFPDVIVHFAEQPSAPFSMRGSYEAIRTQINNIEGTMGLLWAMRKERPNAHLIKLGTMGEYSDWIYKDSPIPEDTRMSVLRMDPMLDGNHFLDIPTPRFAGSFYHMSKIFDSYNIEFACKMWGLRATDINQGVVYGSKIEAMGENNRTRFDYDSYFGTAVNRFVVQSIQGMPLTVYGAGGQTRGYININDAMRAIELVMDNPAEAGELQIVNQLTEVKSVKEIAHMVSGITGADIRSVANPRVEKEQHSYNPEYKKLKSWGLTDPKLMEDVLPDMIEDLKQFKDNIKPEVIMPKTYWRTEHEEGKAVA